MYQTFDSQAQSQIVQTILDQTVRNKKRFIRQLNFTKYTKQQNNLQYQNFHLRIRIQCASDRIRTQLLQNIQIHTIYSSPNIQQYYSVLKHKTNKFKLNIEAEIYRYTLADIIIYLKKKEIKMDKQSLKFFIHSIIEIYKYLMYIISKVDPQLKKLQYQICPQNLGFSQNYKLMLLNPCASNLNKPYHQLGTQTNKFLQLKLNIYETMKELRQWINLQNEQLYDKFTTWLQSSLNDLTFSLQKYKKSQKLQIKQFEEELGLIAVPESLWIFLKSQFQPHYFTQQKNNPMFRRISKGEKKSRVELIEKLKSLLH